MKEKLTKLFADEKLNKKYKEKFENQIVKFLTGVFKELALQDKDIPQGMTKVEYWNTTLKPPLECAVKLELSRR